MQGEYRGDFTRDTFHPAHRYCRVLQQQGRVQLDADANEQTSILLHFLQRLGRDVIGQHGGVGTSFQIVKGPKGVTDDLLLIPGEYYVDGILCEQPLAFVPGIIVGTNQIRLDRPLLGGAVRGERWITVLRRKDRAELFTGQIDGADAPLGTFKLKNAGASIGAEKEEVLIVALGSYRNQPFATDLAELDKLQGPYLIYLDVWERHLTHVQNDGMREVALQGPDTASRSQIVWQLKIESVPPDGLTVPLKADGFSELDWQIWTDRWQPLRRGLLRARVKPQTVTTDPCLISPRSAYRGAENQLYRVEIHQGTPPPNPDGTRVDPTFKWSRENGSVVFPILALATSADRTTVTLAHLGRDRKLSLKVNDWVEVCDDATSLGGVSNPLLQVVEIDHAAFRVTLGGTSPVVVKQPTLRHPLLRRWEGIGVVPAKGTEWIPLEDGIEIQFPVNEGDPAPIYRGTDYWLFPARVETGDIEWPRLRDAEGQVVVDGNRQTTPLALAPHGVEHHYAPLATVSATKQLFDQRRVIKPIAS